MRTDIATTRPNRPSGPIWWKGVLKLTFTRWPRTQRAVEEFPILIMAEPLYSWLVKLNRFLEGNYNLSVIQSWPQAASWRMCSVWNSAHGFLGLFRSCGFILGNSWNRNKLVFLFYLILPITDDHWWSALGAVQMLHNHFGFFLRPPVFPSPCNYLRDPLLFKTVIYCNQLASKTILDKHFMKKL